MILDQENHNCVNGDGGGGGGMGKEYLCSLLIHV